MWRFLRLCFTKKSKIILPLSNHSKLQIYAAAAAIWSQISQSLKLYCLVPLKFSLSAHTSCLLAPTSIYSCFLCLPLSPLCAAQSTPPSLPPPAPYPPRATGTKSTFSSFGNRGCLPDPGSNIWTEATLKMLTRDRLTRSWSKLSNISSKTYPRHLVAAVWGVHVTEVKQG